MRRGWGAPEEAGPGVAGGRRGTGQGAELQDRCWPVGRNHNHSVPSLRFLQLRFPKCPDWCPRRHSRHSPNPPTRWGPVTISPAPPPAAPLPVAPPPVGQHVHPVQDWGALTVSPGPSPCSPAACGSTANT